MPKKEKNRYFCLLIKIINCSIRRNEYDHHHRRRPCGNWHGVLLKQSGVEDFVNEEGIEILEMKIRFDITIVQTKIVWAFLILSIETYIIEGTEQPGRGGVHGDYNTI